MVKSTDIDVQNTSPYNIAVSSDNDRLSVWLEIYFEIEVTTAERSKKEQRRALETFVNFLVMEAGDDLGKYWTPHRIRPFRERYENQISESDYADGRHLPTTTSFDISGRLHSGYTSTSLSLLAIRWKA